MDSLHEHIGQLCEELNLAVPQSEGGTEDYRLSVEDVPLRFHVLSNGQTILSASLGRVPEMAEAAGEDPGYFLLRCIRLHGARLAKLALPFTLSLEPDTEEVILWKPVSQGIGGASQFSPMVEELLNEVEYRRNWLGIAPAAR